MNSGDRLNQIVTAFGVRHRRALANRPTNHQFDVVDRFAFVAKRTNRLQLLGLRTA